MNLTYAVNPDGTGKSNVAHFVITQAKKIGNQLVGTEVFFIADALDPFTGNLQTTTANEACRNPQSRAGRLRRAEPEWASMAAKSSDAAVHTQQITVVRTELRRGRKT